MSRLTYPAMHHVLNDTHGASVFRPSGLACILGTLVTTNRLFSQKDDSSIGCDIEELLLPLPLELCSG